MVEETIVLVDPGRNLPNRPRASATADQCHGNPHTCAPSFATSYLQRHDRLQLAQSLGDPLALVLLTSCFAP